MPRGGNVRLRPGIFICFVFAQSFFKFYKNDDNRKLNAWSFRLRKNDFCRLYNERARARQISTTFFLYILYDFNIQQLCSEGDCITDNLAIVSP